MNLYIYIHIFASLLACFSSHMLRVSVARLIFAINLSMCLCFMANIKEEEENSTIRPAHTHIGGGV